MSTSIQRASKPDAYLAIDDSELDPDNRSRRNMENPQLTSRSAAAAAVRKPVIGIIFYSTYGHVA